ncbi:MAG: AbrB/MazE/SpoVT family DNA-binding domain-containing protein [bacterium]|nr:AbrB/MazE/SpoVT family DNA-binding domain-containing protein [bacterium]
MQHSAIMSSKGQIVIPKLIRDQLRISVSDRIVMTIQNDSIILKPSISTNEVFGIFKAKSPITKNNIKDSFRKSTLDKFSKK